MSEAPERIWVDVCEYVNLAPSWIDELRVAHKDSYVNDDLSGQQYIRADIHEARIKELEAQLVAQNPEIKGLRALQGVTYVSVSDKNGRMDDDLFELVEAQNRIADLEAQVTWQPIETAPKTGISVLLWNETLEECTSGWYRVNHAGDQWRNENDLGIEATHWMPLPNPPKENET